MGHVGLMTAGFIGGGDVGFRAYSYNYNPSITGTCNVSYNPVVSHVPPKFLNTVIIGLSVPENPQTETKTQNPKPYTRSPIPQTPYLALQ